MAGWGILFPGTGHTNPMTALTRRLQQCGDPLVVRYAPQLEIVKKAALVITHAGLNTVLESLAAGAPLVALRLGTDQLGVAARVAARGAGVAIPPRKLTTSRLRSAVSIVLEEPSYRIAAQHLALAMSRVDGLEIAADVVETTLAIAPSTEPESSLVSTGHVRLRN